MENEKQSDEEEIETFFTLIRRLGEIRRKNDEMSTIRDAGADAGDRDQVDYKKKKIKWTVDDRLDRGSSSNWVPCFELEDFGEVVGSRRSPPSPELQQHVNINSEELVLIQVEDIDSNKKHHQLEDDDDDDDCGLNLKLTL